MATQEDYVQRFIACSVIAALTASALPNAAFASGFPGGSETATPIKHVVVIFEENISFDHYFGTYPNATNPAGEPRFVAAPGTPSVNGYTGVLLTNNPNAPNPVNGGGQTHPFPRA